MLNATIVYAALLILGAIIKYIIFGKPDKGDPNLKVERLALKNRLIGLSIIIGIYLFMVWSILDSQL